MDATIDVLENQICHLQHQLQIKDALLNLCLDSLPKAVKLVSLKDGRILHVNRAWQEQFGYSLLEAQQLFLVDLIAPNRESDQADRTVEGFYPKFEHQEESIEMWLQTKHQVPVKMLAEIQLQTLSHSTEAMPILFLSLSPVDLVNAKSEQQANPLGLDPLGLDPLGLDPLGSTPRQETPGDRQKTLEVCVPNPDFRELCTHFVTRASHELRTPLAVIASSASILTHFGDQIDVSKKNHHLQCIQTYVQHTTQILDEILLLYKADTGYLECRPTACDCLELIEELVKDLNIQSPDRLIAISTAVQPTRSAQSEDLNSSLQWHKVLIDRGLFRQIFTHLLSNANKYSHPESLIKIAVTLQEDTIRIAIEDQGIGIAPEDLSQICQLFHRGQNVGTIPGTGLGLCIVEKCLALHGGQLEVCSQLNQGSIFTVTIPRLTQA